MSTSVKKLLEYQCIFQILEQQRSESDSIEKLVERGIVCKRTGKKYNIMESLCR